MIILINKYYDTTKKTCAALCARQPTQSYDLFFYQMNHDDS